MLQRPGYTSQGSVWEYAKRAGSEVTCRATHVLESRALNSQPAGCFSSQVTVPVMFQQVVQTAFLTQGSL